MRHADRQAVLAKLIRHRLLDMERTESWLAKQIGVSERTFSNKINGSTDWKFRELVELADVLFGGNALPLFEEHAANDGGAHPFSSASGDGEKSRHRNVKIG